MPQFTPPSVPPPPWAGVAQPPPARPKVRRSTVIGAGVVGLVVLFAGVGIGSAGTSGADGPTAGSTVTSTVTATVTHSATSTVSTVRTVTVTKPGPTRTVTRPGPTVTVTATAGVVRTSSQAQTSAPADNSANCTPGYSPCIPPGPDVDCAGGSGNGPRYVQGPVYVTGSDPYGLDADHDGIGCE